MGAEPTITTVEHAGFNFSSNTGSAEEVTASVKAIPIKGATPATVETTETKDGQSALDDRDPHAVALGERGGKATAEKRAAEKEAAETAAEPEDEGAEAKRKASEDIEKAPPEQKKKVASDRVAEATREAARLKRELAAERTERQAERERLQNEFRQRQAQAQDPAKAEAKSADADKGPQPDQYDTYEEYVDARTDWKAEKMASKLIKSEVENQARQAAIYQAAKTQTDRVVSHVQTFNSRVSEAAKADTELLSRVDERIMNLEPSFTLQSGQSVGPENVICDEIMLSDAAPALMLHLSEHPDDFQRIASLQTPRDISREMAKLEARLERATVGTPQPKPEVSKAKPPARPTTGAPAIAEGDGFREGMSFDDYYAKNAKKVLTRR